MKKKIISLRIGGIGLTFYLRNAKMASLILSRYRGYIETNAADCLYINCSFSSKKFSNHQTVVLFPSSGQDRRALRYDFDCSWTNTHGKATMWPSIYSFDACLRVMCATRAMLHGGLLLHAAAVVRKGRAFVFAGPSGSGKTTITGLSKVKKILSDEIVAITHDKHKRVFAGSTPFWGEMGTGPSSRKSYPVGSVFFLKKSDGLKKMTLSNSEALQKLLRCACLFGKHPEDIQLALDICAHIIQTTPVYDLYFEKKPLIWSKLIFRN
jgi:hypothetical protein